MKFCSQCDNKYYITISDDDVNKLSYYCRNCGNKDADTEENICVINNQSVNGNQMYQYFINEYTKYDPTLPSIDTSVHIDCPNPDCITNSATKKKPSNIVYLRYDDKNLKYTYICVECNYSWITS